MPIKLSSELILFLGLFYSFLDGNSQKLNSTHYTGVTRELNSKTVVSARVQIIDIESKEVVYSMKSGNQGVIKTKLQQGKKYEVSVSNSDYVGVKDTILILKEGKASTRVDTFYLKKPTSSLPTVRFEGFVYDRLSGVKVSVDMTGEVFNSRIVHFDFALNPDSQYVFDIIAFKKQKVIITAKGYLPQVFEFNPQDYSGKKIVELDFYLTRITPNEYSVLASVHFVQSRPEFVHGSEKELMDLVLYLKQHPNAKVDLAGHTDNVGLKELNVKLSEERVQTVSDFLTSYGIDLDRISGKGFGGEMPIAPNENEQSRRLNRRVEFKILEKLPD